ncbi:hypothetical protein Ddye_013979 [Dipteronia dyeriana]|uniref:Uncharacterized protein n=1 Tax=Dipteronia dyeriana TaxID=168575 RepID=A0AAD9X7F3_9ROSI|nr:hypothetical protein Ddye_013979 [Dipteronia dyeriana]
MHFHWKALARRSRNGIKGLFDSNGHWTYDKEGIVGVIEHYFDDIFSSNFPSSQELKRVLDCIQPCLSARNISFLDIKFSPEEVGKAIFDMSPTKAPGLVDSRLSFIRNFGR